MGCIVKVVFATLPTSAGDSQHGLQPHPEYRGENVFGLSIPKQDDEVVLGEVEWTGQHFAILPPREAHFLFTSLLDVQLFDTSLIAGRKPMNSRFAEFLSIFGVSRAVPLR